MGQNQTQNQIFCHFLKFGSLVFLEIACNNSLQHCLISSGAKIHEKRFCSPNFCQRGQNRAQNQVFCHFLKFGSLVFLKIAYSDSLLQCLTSSTVKILKKIFRDQTWVKMAKSGPKLSFLSFSQVWFIKLHTAIASYNVLHLVDIVCNSLQHCLISSGAKIHEKKILQSKFLPKGPKLGPKTRFFVIFSSLVHQFSLKLHTAIVCYNV